MDQLQHQVIGTSFLLTTLPKPWLFFFDDICIGVNTKDEFKSALISLFKWAYQYNLTIHIKKSDFFTETIDLLGYTISYNKISPSVKSQDNVLQLTKPKNVKQLQSLLGTINYQRRFIPELAKYCLPLNKLLRNKKVPVIKKDAKPISKSFIHGGNIYKKEDYTLKSVKIKVKDNIFDDNLPYSLLETKTLISTTESNKKVYSKSTNLLFSKWDEECDKALNKIKQLILLKPLLIPPNFNKPFIIYVDASEQSIGGVILQTVNNRATPVEYGSHALSEAQETKWTIAEKEAYALVYFLDKWKQYFFIETTP